MSLNTAITMEEAAQLTFDGVSEAASKFFLFFPKRNNLQRENLQKDKLKTVFTRNDNVKHH